MPMTSLVGLQKGNLRRRGQEGFVDKTRWRDNPILGAEVIYAVAHHIAGQNCQGASLGYGWP